MTIHDAAKDKPGTTESRLQKPVSSFSDLLDLDAFRYRNNKSSRTPSNSSAHYPISPKSSPRKKTPRKYADPQVYAHLPQSVPDVIASKLYLLIIGLNPGIATAKAGHVFAGPNNHFWPLLYQSGITPVQLHYSQDQKLLEYGCGVTNIIDRPTTESSELSKTELVQSVPRLFQKISLYQPRAICILGKSIWDAIEKHYTGRYPGKDFHYGWQKDIDGIKVFVIMSTSGRVASYKKQDKLKLFMEVADWLNKERDKAKGSIL